MQTESEIVEVTTTRSFRADRLWTLADAMQRAHDAGSHYFDADTRRFFAARYGAHCSLPDGSLLFVESTEWRGRVPRSWKVRLVTRKGEIETPTGDAVGLSSSAAGKRAFERLKALAWHGWMLGKLVSP